MLIVVAIIILAISVVLVGVSLFLISKSVLGTNTELTHRDSHYSLMGMIGFYVGIGLFASGFVLLGIGLIFK